MKTWLAGLSPAERHARSLAACNELIATREFKHAQNIMIFMSMPSEVETSALAVKAWQEGKEIAVPRVNWQNHHMEPIQIKSLDVGMQTSGPGIREPAEGNAMPLCLIDMVVVPGMAFDRRGYRIGRGRGFYDRFLSQKDFHGIRCALCFHEQVHAHSLPTESHDIQMNMIVTDREVIRCHPHP